MERGRGGDGQGAYLSHISLLQRRKNIPGLQRWTHSLTLSAPTLSLLHCELVTHTHTHTHKRGASVTADCDRNGWKLLLPPFPSHTVYRCVPPSLFHSLWRFYLCQAWQMGASTSFSQLFNTSSLTFNSFCHVFYTVPHFISTCTPQSQSLRCYFIYF